MNCPPSAAILASKYISHERVDKQASRVGSLLAALYLQRTRNLASDWDWPSTCGMLASHGILPALIYIDLLLFLEIDRISRHSSRLSLPRSYLDAHLPEEW